MPNRIKYMAFRNGVQFYSKLSTMKVVFLFLFWEISHVNGSPIEVFDFFGDGIKDHAAIRYADLKSSPDIEFSSEVTICSSIYMRSFIMEQSLFQFLDVNNSPWFSLYFLQLDEETLTHPFSLAVKGVYTHLAQVEANPLRWNHACIGRQKKLENFKSNFATFRI